MKTPINIDSNSISIQSELVQIGDSKLCMHSWPVSTTPVTAVALIYHGFLAHGLYPTVRYAANALHSIAGVQVVSFDLRGHGRSKGLAGYLPSAKELLLEAVAIAHYVHERFVITNTTTNRKFFLVGSSMGGAIALGVSQTIQLSLDGIILMAPMLQLSVSPLERTLLYGLACILPAVSCIPSKSSSSAALQYRDPIKRQECEQDAFVTTASTIRAGSACTCVELTHLLDFTQITAPLLILVADEDVIVQNAGAERLMEQAIHSVDKTLFRYPALHGLLCEPRPLLDEIEHDLIEWVQKRIR